MRVGRWMRLSSRGRRLSVSTCSEGWVWDGVGTDGFAVRYGDPLDASVQARYKH